METIEERLSEIECPWRSVTVLEASLETNESGRGINSILSENPTLVVFGWRGGVTAGSTVASMSISFVVSDVDCMTLSREFANARADGPSDGLVGALPLTDTAVGLCGFIIIDRSWHEIAAERR